MEATERGHRAETEGAEMGGWGGEGGGGGGRGSWDGRRRGRGV